MQDKLKELLNYDTPSITNVVATYPGDAENCLGLYHPWEGKWYTDQRLRCMYPEHGRRVGYVVTCVYGEFDAAYKRLGFGNLFQAIAASPGPVVLAVKQNLPERIKNISGLLGGLMMTSFKSLGVVGVLSDGPSRDIDECRPLGIQCLLTGVSPGHGNYSLQAVNVPVEICGMDLMPGDLVHMDENGAAKFPADRVDDILVRAERLQRSESKRLELMGKTSDPVELTKIITGAYDM